MSTNPRTSGTIKASEVWIGGLYRTMVESGEVTVRVTRELPRSPTARNRTFETLDVATGQLLPRPKRAEDLDPLVTPWRGPRPPSCSRCDGYGDQHGCPLCLAGTALYHLPSHVLPILRANRAEWMTTSHHWRREWLHEQYQRLVHIVAESDLTDAQAYAIASEAARTESGSRVVYSFACEVLTLRRQRAAERVPYNVGEAA